MSEINYAILHYVFLHNPSNLYDMNVIFLIVIGTVIALILIYAIVAHKKRRAKQLELIRQIKEEQRQQDLKNNCRPNSTKKRVLNNDNVNENDDYDEDYEYYRLMELKEVRDAYDDYIASLDMNG